jgi:hypothetical protein
MTVQEIKSIFKLDLKINNRERFNVFVKAVYIDRQEGKSLTELAKELDFVSHASVFNIKKKTHIYKQYPQYEKIEQAFDIKSKQLFDEAHVEYDKYIDKKSKLTKSRKAPADYTQKLSKVNIPPARDRWHYLKIIETLRKDNDHKLWNKPIPLFTFKDYEKLNTLLIS